MMILFLLLLLPISAQALELRGEARSPRGDFAYREKLHIQLGPDGLSQRIDTEYLRADGAAFARMRSDFSKDPLIPDAQFDDLRTGIREEVIYRKEERLVVVRHSKKDTPPSEVKIPVRPGMVAGQGFDNFLRMNFDKLRVETLPFPFVVPAKSDYFSFEVRSENGSSPDRVRFGLKMSSFFLKMLVREIRVEYDAKSRTLLHFDGLSNLEDDGGNSQYVKINYRVESP